MLHDRGNSENECILMSPHIDILYEKGDEGSRRGRGGERAVEGEEEGGKVDCLHRYYLYRYYLVYKLKSALSV